MRAKLLRRIRSKYYFWKRDMGIEARELRIGNFVNEVCHGISEATKVGKNTFKRWDGLNLHLVLFGIPLTEEWLLKFGFTKKIESDTLTVFWIGHNKVTHDYLFELKYHDGFPFFYRNGRHMIYYVHQLQNLYYALTGEELKLS